MCGFCSLKQCFSTCFYFLTNPVLHKQRKTLQNGTLSANRVIIMRTYSLIFFMIIQLSSDQLSTHTRAFIEVEILSGTRFTVCTFPVQIFIHSCRDHCFCCHALRISLSSIELTRSLANYCQYIITQLVTPSQAQTVKNVKIFAATEECFLEQISENGQNHSHSGWKSLL